MELIKWCELIARQLVKGRILAFLIGVASFFSLVYVATFGTIELQNQVAVPCLLTILWSLLFFVFIRVFSYSSTEQTQKTSMFARFKRKIKRIFYTLFSWFFLLLTLSILYLTYKMLSVWG
jgi:NADH:ubiquinone oxidoreductase subunit 6 (subunit J)